MTQNGGSITPTRHQERSSSQTRKLAGHSIDIGDGSDSKREQEASGAYALTFLFQNFIADAERIVLSAKDYPDMNFLRVFSEEQEPGFNRCINALCQLAAESYSSELINALNDWKKGNLQGGAIHQGDHRRRLTESDAAPFVLQSPRVSSNPSGGNSYQMSQVSNRDPKQTAKEARALMADLLCAKCIIKTLRCRLDKGGQTLLDGHLMEQLSDQAMENMRSSAIYYPTQSPLNRSALHSSYATVLGVIGEKKLGPITSKMLGLLTNTVNVNMTFALINGMEYLKLQTFPMQALEETCDFLMSCANYFNGLRKNQDIKAAFSTALSRLLLPLAASVKSEVNVPVFRKAIETLFKAVYDSSRKSKYLLSCFPLIVNILSCSQKGFFLEHWSSFLNIALSNLKNKDGLTARLCFACAHRLLYVYVMRIKQEDGKVVGSRLKLVCADMFPKGTRQMLPKDTDPDAFAQVIRLMAHAKFEYAMEDVILDILSNMNIQSSKSIPFSRIMTGLRAYLYILRDRDEKIKEVEFPTYVNANASERVDGLPGTTSSGMMNAADSSTTEALSNRPVLSQQRLENIGMARYHAAVGAALSDLLVAMNASCVHTFVDNPTSVSGDLQRGQGVLKLCLQSMPYVMPTRLSKQDMLTVIARNTIHVDKNIRKTALECLKRIVDQCPHLRGAVVSGYCHFVMNEIPDTHLHVLEGVCMLLRQIVAHCRDIIIRESRAYSGEATAQSPDVKSSSTAGPAANESGVGSSDPSGVNTSIGEQHFIALEAVGISLLILPIVSLRRLGILLLRDAKHLARDCSSAFALREAEWLDSVSVSAPLEDMGTIRVFDILVERAKSPLSSLLAMGNQPLATTTQATSGQTAGVQMGVSGQSGGVSGAGGKPNEAAGASSQMPVSGASSPIRVPSSPLASMAADVLQLRAGTIATSSALTDHLCEFAMASGKQAQPTSRRQTRARLMNEVAWNNAVGDFLRALPPQQCWGLLSVLKRNFACRLVSLSQLVCGGDASDGGWHMSKSLMAGIEMLNAGQFSDKFTAGGAHVLWRCLLMSYAASAVTSIGLATAAAVRTPGPTGTGMNGGRVYSGVSSVGAGLNDSSVSTSAAGSDVGGGYAAAGQDLRGPSSSAPEDVAMPLHRRGPASSDASEHSGRVFPRVLSETAAVDRRHSRRSTGGLSNHDDSTASAPGVTGHHRGSTATQATMSANVHPSSRPISLTQGSLLALQDSAVEVGSPSSALSRKGAQGRSSGLSMKEILGSLLPLLRNENEMIVGPVVQALGFVHPDSLEAVLTELRPLVEETFRASSSKDDSAKKRRRREIMRLHLARIYSGITYNQECLVLSHPTIATLLTAYSDAIKGCLEVEYHAENEDCYLRMRWEYATYIFNLCTACGRDADALERLLPKEVRLSAFFLLSNWNGVFGKPVGGQGSLGAVGLQTGAGGGSSSGHASLPGASIFAGAIGKHHHRGFSNNASSAHGGANTRGSAFGGPGGGGPLAGDDDPDFELAQRPRGLIMAALPSPLMAYTDSSSSGGFGRSGGIRAGDGGAKAAAEYTDTLNILLYDCCNHAMASMCMGHPFDGRPIDATSYFVQWIDVLLSNPALNSAVIGPGDPLTIGSGLPRPRGLSYTGQTPGGTGTVDSVPGGGSGAAVAVATAKADFSRRSSALTVADGAKSAAAGSGYGGGRGSGFGVRGGSGSGGGPDVPSSDDSYRAGISALEHLLRHTNLMPSLLECVLARCFNGSTIFVTRGYFTALCRVLTDPDLHEGRREAWKLQLQTNNASSLLFVTLYMLGSYRVDIRLAAVALFEEIFPPSFMVVPVLHYATMGKGQTVRSATIDCESGQRYWDDAHLSSVSSPLPGTYRDSQQQFSQALAMSQKFWEDVALERKPSLLSHAGDYGLPTPGDKAIVIRGQDRVRSQDYALCSPLMVIREMARRFLVAGRANRRNILQLISPWILCIVEDQATPALQLRELFEVLLYLTSINEDDYPQEIEYLWRIATQEVQHFNECVRFMIEYNMAVSSPQAMEYSRRVIAILSRHQSERLSEVLALMLRAMQHAGGSNRRQSRQVNSASWGLNGARRIKTTDRREDSSGSDSLLDAIFSGVSKDSSSGGGSTGNNLAAADSHISMSSTGTGPLTERSMGTLNDGTATTATRGSGGSANRGSSNSRFTYATGHLKRRLRKRESMQRGMMFGPLIDLVPFAVDIMAPYTEFDIGVMLLRDLVYEQTFKQFFATYLPDIMHCILLISIQGNIDVSEQAAQLLQNLLETCRDSSSTSATTAAGAPGSAGMRRTSSSEGMLNTAAPSSAAALSSSSSPGARSAVGGAGSSAVPAAASGSATSAAAKIVPAPTHPEHLLLFRKQFEPLRTAKNLPQGHSAGASGGGSAGTGLLLTEHDVQDYVAFVLRNFDHMTTDLETKWAAVSHRWSTQSIYRNYAVPSLLVRRFLKAPISRANVLEHLGRIMPLVGGNVESDLGAGDTVRTTGTYNSTASKRSTAGGGKGGSNVRKLAKEMAERTAYCVETMKTLRSMLYMSNMRDTNQVAIFLSTAACLLTSPVAQEFRHGVGLLLDTLWYYDILEDDGSGVRYLDEAMVSATLVVEELWSPSKQGFVAPKNGLRDPTLESHDTKESSDNADATSKFPGLLVLIENILCKRQQCVTPTAWNLALAPGGIFYGGEQNVTVDFCLTLAAALSPYLPNRFVSHDPNTGFVFTTMTVLPLLVNRLRTGVDALSMVSDDGGIGVGPSGAAAGGADGVRRARSASTNLQYGQVPGSGGTPNGGKGPGLDGSATSSATGGVHGHGSSITVNDATGAQHPKRSSLGDGRVAVVAADENPRLPSAAANQFFAEVDSARKPFEIWRKFLLENPKAVQGVRCPVLPSVAVGQTAVGFSMAPGNPGDMDTGLSATMLAPQGPSLNSASTDMLGGSGSSPTPVTFMHMPSRDIIAFKLMETLSGQAETLGYTNLAKVCLQYSVLMAAASGATELGAQGGGAGTGGQMRAAASRMSVAVPAGANAATGGTAQGFLDTRKLEQWNDDLVRFVMSSAFPRYLVYTCDLLADLIDVCSGQDVAQHLGTLAQIFRHAATHKFYMGHVAMPLVRKLVLKLKVADGFDALLGFMSTVVSISGSAKSGASNPLDPFNIEPGDEESYFYNPFSGDGTSSGGAGGSSQGQPSMAENTILLPPSAREPPPATVGELFRHLVGLFVATEAIAYSVSGDMFDNEEHDDDDQVADSVLVSTDPSKKNVDGSDRQDDDTRRTLTERVLSPVGSHPDEDHGFDEYRAKQEEGNTIPADLISEDSTIGADHNERAADADDLDHGPEKGHEDDESDHEPHHTESVDVLGDSFQEGTFKDTYRDFFQDVEVVTALAEFDFLENFGVEDDADFALPTGGDLDEETEDYVEHEDVSVKLPRSYGIGEAATAPGDDEDLPSSTTLDGTASLGGSMPNLASQAKAPSATGSGMLKTTNSSATASAASSRTGTVSAASSSTALREEAGRGLPQALKPQLPPKTRPSVRDMDSSVDIDTDTPKTSVATTMSSAGGSGEGAAVAAAGVGLTAATGARTPEESSPVASPRRTRPSRENSGADGVAPETTGSLDPISAAAHRTRSDESVGPPKVPPHFATMRGRGSAAGNRGPQFEGSQEMLQELTQQILAKHGRSTADLDSVGSTGGMRSSVTASNAAAARSMPGGLNRAVSLEDPSLGAGVPAESSPLRSRAMDSGGSASISARSVSADPGDHGSGMHGSVRRPTRRASPREPNRMADPSASGDVTARVSAAVAPPLPPRSTAGAVGSSAPDLSGAGSAAVAGAVQRPPPPPQRTRGHTLSTAQGHAVAAQLKSEEAAADLASVGPARSLPAVGVTTDDAAAAQLVGPDGKPVPPPRPSRHRSAVQRPTYQR
eukprot:Clim_evm77s22 gene=Clim_evmTU77s22